MTRAQDTNEDEAKPKRSPQRERPARPQNGINRLAEELKLTDEQKPKFEAVLKERRQKQLELRQDTVLSQEERVAKVREMRADTTAKMKAILDAEQFEKFEKLEKAQRAEVRTRAAARAEKAAGEKPPSDKPAGETPPAEKSSDEK
jgi:Spy/CpxP family protein refolding chaperone